MKRPPAASGARNQSRSQGVSGRMRLTVLLLLIAPLLASCGDLLYQDGAEAPEPVLLTLDRSLESQPLAEAEFQSAFETVNAVHVLLVQSSDRSVVLDEVFSVTVSGGEIRLQIEAELPEQTESFDLEVELRVGEASLFRGATPLTLRPGAEVQPEIVLEPLPAGLAIWPESPGPLQSLGETVSLSASLVFATGAPFPPLDVSWESLDPQIVSISSGGVVTAEGPGVGRVRAVGAGFSTQAEIEVDLVPASIEVDPAAADLVPGEQLQLTAVVRDSGGSRISVPVEWTSSDPSVATVSDEGLVEAQDLGSAVIQATSGGQSAEVQVEVVARAPTVETVGATHIAARSARIRGRVNPRGFDTQVWFEWSTDPSLEDPQVTEPRHLSASSKETLVGHNLADLEPGTRYYFRVLASNEVGEAQGDIRSFATAEAVVAEIQVEPAELELGILETAQLTAVVLDAGGDEVNVDVEWSSSDEEVVTVTAQGEVQGQVEGSATIEARVGDVVAQAQVVVVAAPPLVETLEAADVTEASARLRGSVNPSGLETTAWFEWSANAELLEPITTASMDLAPSAEDVAVDHELADLQPGTYYYRVVAENEVGTSAGEVLQFTTPLPAPTALDVQITLREGPALGLWLRAEWSYDVESYPDAAFQVEVRRISPEVGAWELAAETEETRVFIEDAVTADITYEFRVRACRPDDCSDWSESVELTPSGGGPGVTNRPAIGHDGTEATLRAWVRDGGHETEFYFEWGDNSDFVDWTRTPIRTVTRSGFSSTGPEEDTAGQEDDGPAPRYIHRVEAFLTGLTPGETYYYIATAQNPDGSDTDGNVHSFVAGEVPPPIEDLTLSDFGYVYGSWSWPHFNGGGPDYYEVERQVGSGGEWHWRFDRTVTDFTDSQVESGVQYGYRVRACFENGGCSEVSDPEFIVVGGSGEMDAAAQEAAASISDRSTELREPDRLSLRSPPQALRPARGWR